MENPIKLDDLGVHYFRKHPYMKRPASSAPSGIFAYATFGSDLSVGFGKSWLHQGRLFGRCLVESKVGRTGVVKWWGGWLFYFSFLQNP